ncbi:hypothetical protein [Mycobacterium spongiae]|uniref:Uncharacterized protein n=1 Tax=Mycobacterium spongiae TaxID=886343 RepID=A0A975JU64_9MYCO|nr:hypothetical protein [Mycobacterium spongiae]QUR65754.1 hypothetical protein F6B93_00480 [Mycobacterium spongiae]
MHRVAGGTDCLNHPVEEPPDDLVRQVPRRDLVMATILRTFHRIHAG